MLDNKESKMARLRLMSDQNPWWKFGSGFAQYDRHLSDLDKALIRIERRELSLKPDSIFIIRGPRQVGKTTQLKLAIKNLLNEGVNPRNIFFLSLDQFSGRRELRDSLDYFSSVTKGSDLAYVFLDEITRLEGWSEELKRLYDIGFTKRAAIVATGSSPSQIKELSERMPGRGVEGNEYILKPLCFREFALQVGKWLSRGSYKVQIPKRGGLSVKYVEETRHYLAEKDRVALAELCSKLQKILFKPESRALDLKAFSSLDVFIGELSYLFDLYLHCGGYPKAINNYLHYKLEKKSDNIDSEVAEVIVRDFLGDISKVGIRDEILALNILEEVIKHYGSRYSFNELARGIAAETEREAVKKPSHVTTKNYLSVLEASFVAFVQYFMDQAGGINTNKQKKVYFFDPFLYSSLLSYKRGQTLWTVISEVLSDEESISRLVEGVVVAHLRLWQEEPYKREPWSFLGFYYDRSTEVDAVTKIGQELWGIEVKFRSQARRIRRIPSHLKKLLVITQEEMGEEKKILYLPASLFLSLISPSPRNL